MTYNKSYNNVELAFSYATITGAQISAVLDTEVQDQYYEIEQEEYDNILNNNIDPIINGVEQCNYARLPPIGIRKQFKTPACEKYVFEDGEILLVEDTRKLNIEVNRVRRPNGKHTREFSILTEPTMVTNKSDTLFKDLFVKARDSLISDEQNCISPVFQEQGFFEKEEQIALFHLPKERLPYTGEHPPLSYVKIHKILQKINNNKENPYIEWIGIIDQYYVMSAPSISKYRYVEVIDVINNQKYIYEVVSFKDENACKVTKRPVSVAPNIRASVVLFNNQLDGKKEAAITRKRQREISGSSMFSAPSPNYIDDEPMQEQSAWFPSVPPVEVRVDEASINRLRDVASNVRVSHDLAEGSSELLMESVERITASLNQVNERIEEATRSVNEHVESATGLIPKLFEMFKHAGPVSAVSAVAFAVLMYRKPCAKYAGCLAASCFFVYQCYPDTLSNILGIFQNMPTEQEDPEIMMEQISSADLKPFVSGLVLTLSGLKVASSETKHQVSNLVTQLFEYRKHSDSMLEMFSDVLSMFQSLLEVVQRNVFGKDVDIFFTHGDYTIDKFLEKLSKLKDRIVNHDFEYIKTNYEEVVELRKEAEQIMAKMPRTVKSTGIHTSILSAINYLVNLQNKFEHKQFQFEGVREEPVVVLLRGKPGLGKSYATPFIAHDLLPLCVHEDKLEEVMRDSQHYIHPVTPETGFWDGYTPSKKIAIWDDFGQLIDTKGVNDSEFMKFIRAANIQEYLLRMAGVDQKGCYRFNCSFIIMNTNQIDFMTESIVSKEALLRRFTKTYDVCIKEEYALPGSIDPKERKLDYTKLPTGWKGVTSLNPRLIHEYHEYDWKEKKFTGTVIDYDTLIETIYDLKAQKHVWHEQFVGELNDLKISAIERFRRRKQERLDTMSEQSIFVRDPDPIERWSGKLKVPKLTVMAPILRLSEADGWDTPDGVNDCNAWLRMLDWYIKHNDGFDIDDWRHFVDIVESVRNRGSHENLWGRPADPFWSVPVGELTLLESAIQGVKDAMNTVHRLLMPVSWFCDLFVHNWLRNSVHNIVLLFGLLGVSKLVVHVGRWVINWFLSLFGYEGFKNPFDQLVPSYAENMSHTHTHGEYMALGVNCEKCANNFKHNFYKDPNVKSNFKNEVLENADKVYEVHTKLSCECSDEPLYKDLDPPGCYSRACKFYKVWHDEMVANSKVKEQSTHHKQRKTARRHMDAREMKARAADMLTHQDGLGYDKSSSAILEKLIKRNIYHMYFPGVEIAAGVCTVIGGTVIMLNLHYITRLYEKCLTDERLLDGIIELEKPETKVRIRFPLRYLFQFYYVPGTHNQDVAYVKVPEQYMHTHMNMSKYFVKSTDVLNYRDLKFALLKTNDARIHVFEGHATPSDRIKLEDGSVVERLGYRYDGHTKPGDCGSLFTLLSPHSGCAKILGIHAAGNVSSGKSFATAVFQEHVIDVLAHFYENPPEMEESMEPQDYTPMEFMEPLIKKELKAPVSSKSAIKRSAIETIDGFPMTKKPAKLHKFENDAGNIIDPYDRLIKRYNKTPPVIAEDLMDAAVDSVYDMLHHNSKINFDRRVLSYEEAILGIPNTDFKSISRSTSMGYPWNVQWKCGGGKFNVFGSDQEYDLNTEYALKIKDRVFEIIEKAKKNIRCEHYYTSFLKDETLKFTKVEAGDTRGISGTGLDLLVAFRMYFGTFALWIVDNRIDNGSGLGVNPYSTDWDEIAHRLMSFGDERGRFMSAGDYKGFDISEYPQILWAVFDVIQRTYDDGAENEQVRRVLWREIVNSRHIRWDFVFMMFMSLPSGNPLTTIVNILVNHINFRLCWGIIFGVGKVALFNNNVYLIVLGDDNTWSVHPGYLDKFNVTSIIPAMEMIGMTYTSADKEKQAKMENISEVSFLKRTFRYDRVLCRYVGPLEVASFVNSIYWTKYRDPETVTKDNIETSLREASLHGKEFFEQWSSAICKAAKEYMGYHPQCTSWYGNLQTVAESESYY